MRAMSRSEKSDDLIHALGAVPVRCNLEDVDAEHLSGCEVVVHAAAYVEAWGPSDAWDRINVGGTPANATCRSRNWGEALHPRWH